MHVVFGANGRAGGDTARALIEGGEAVRVAVRRPEQGDPWKALGAEVAVANLEDADTVSEALAGATAAFLLNPPPVSGDPFAQVPKTGAALVEAVRRANLAKAETTETPIDALILSPPRVGGRTTFGLHIVQRSAS